MGGGSGVTGKQQNLAAGQLSQIGSDTMKDSAAQGGIANRTGAAATDFYTNRMNNGLPFYRNLTDYASGTTAQAFAPQRAALLRQTSQYGTNLPSGYRDAMLTNLAAQQGRAFDQNLQGAMYANEQAKQQGAQGVTQEQQIAANRALAYKTLGANVDQSLLSPYVTRKPSGWGEVAGAAQQGLQTGAMLATA